MSEIDCFDLPEETEAQIIQKISALTYSIRSDWSDPRSECREIFRLCGVLELRLGIMKEAGK